MKMDLKQDFLTPVDLPFNRASLDEHFQLTSPDQDPGGKGYWLLLQGMAMLVVDTISGFELSEGDCPPLDSDASAIYIGQWQGKPCRLVAVADDATIPLPLHRQPLRVDDPKMSVPLFSLGGVGYMILHWESVSKHCGNCGTEMVRIANGWGKQCLDCRAQHFPRIHPCVIGLIVKGDEVLLARRPNAPNGRYGLVAGFVDFNECLEEAMARETLEETGLEITNIRYVGSQSWPFPSQLMCGFVADYVGGEIELRDKELDDAIWCRLDQLPNIPPKRSIARYLIDHAAEYLTD
jgi:NAD+ diphosphatase